MAKRQAPDVETVVQRLTTRQFLRLEPALIEAVLKRLERETTFHALFVREVMRDAPPGRLAATWQKALNAVSKAGRQYSVGDAAFRQTIALLQDPRLLAACQATAVAVGAPVVVCAALARDGSEASFDALMAELERARDGRDDWALRYKLNRLHRYAKKGAAWDAFQAAVDAAMGRREAKKAETGVAKSLGLHVPLLELSVHVRAQAGGWLWLSVSDRHETMSLQSDFTKYRAVTKAAELASRFQEIVKGAKLKFDWAQDVAVRTNLRGKHRAAMLDWLAGKRASPVAD